MEDHKVFSYGISINIPRNIKCRNGIDHLCSSPDIAISSLCWCMGGMVLAVGTTDGYIHLYDTIESYINVFSVNLVIPSLSPSMLINRVSLVYFTVR